MSYLPRKSQDELRQHFSPQMISATEEKKTFLLNTHNFIAISARKHESTTEKEMSFSDSLYSQLQTCDWRKDEILL